QIAGISLATPAPFRLPGLVMPPAHAVHHKKIASKPPVTGSIPVGRFFELRQAVRGVTRQTVETLLTQPLGEERVEQIKKVELKNPDSDVFDLPIAFRDPITRENRLLAPPGEVQGRFHIELNVVATDTNLDSGPKTGKNQA